MTAVKKLTYTLALWLTATPFMATRGEAQTIPDGMPAMLGDTLTATGNTLRWTMDDVITRACLQSPDAQAARHTLRRAYWDNRTFRANYLPALSLSSSPSLDRSINQLTMEDGSIRFVSQNYLSTNLTMSLSQRVPFTGGTISLESSLMRTDMFGNNSSHSWKSAPINITYSQSLIGYNSFKWERRIEPIRYQEARRNYVETVQLVAVSAVDKFFAYAKAQSNYSSACQNYANADTLYHLAQGRYEIGTITENEMLQLDINRLSEETNRMDALTEVKERELALRSYLGLLDGDTLPEIHIDQTVPDFIINESQALQMAHANSADMLNLKRRKIEADYSVASARANAGLKASIYLRFGLTQTAENFSDVYSDLLDQQYVSIGLEVPILDWGKGKGQVRVAKSNRDLVGTQVEQSLTDFDQNIRKLVNQFNLQAMRVRIAARTDSTAQRRAEVARRMYILGRSSVLDLNASITEKDNARRTYLNALHTYWSLYYTLRSITLYDFHADTPIQVDYEAVIGE